MTTVDLHRARSLGSQITSGPACLPACDGKYHGVVRVWPIWIQGYGVHANSRRMASFVHALHIGSGYQEFLPASFSMDRTIFFVRILILIQKLNDPNMVSTLMVLSRSVCNHLPKVRAYAGTISLEPSPNSLPFIVLHNHMYPETMEYV
uniref:Uncharacterized protein n=1 Tax=Oryza glumipatula TaxID=40148 RepID=A0A0D9YF52_9ORYZ